MKVLLTGAKGMLARALLNQQPKGWEIQPLGKNALDMTDRSAVQETIHRLHPDMILNCAGFTNVDACEEKKERAFAVNGIGVGYLAEGAESIGARLVHFSTDYIFDGMLGRPYEEEDPAHPLNVYGASKWEGECQIRKRTSNYLIIRTQWLYGDGGNHFVKTILDLAQARDTLTVVADQIGSPTWTEDLAVATWAAVQNGFVGIYHLANSGECSWYTFACRILQETGMKRAVVPCASAEFPRPARRPAYSVLSTQKAAALLGRSLPPWESALIRFLREV